MSLFFFLLYNVCIMHDSIYIYMQNDTIYKTLYKDVYKYKYLQDTICFTDTVVKIQTKDKETVLDSKHYSRGERKRITT
ncbi:MAG: hypothetical protein IJ681_08425, partial [Bacteroidales bacterium]|nr:hypothetical protein [Bacteroidales bacterium]